MAKVRDILLKIEEFASLDLQEEYDNSGLIIGDYEKEVNAVLITMDVTLEVIEEAIDKGCGLIVSHHPLIFQPIKYITLDTLQGEIIISAIKNDIAIYAAHTNVDNADENIAREFMNLLNIENLCPMIDSPAMKASLEKPCTFKELIDKVKEITGDTNIKSIGSLDDIVEEISFANGANGGDKELLVQAGAVSDVFITSEIKYHLAIMAKQLGLNVIECGHFESEREFFNLISRKLSGNIEGVKIINSASSVSPYNAH